MIGVLVLVWSVGEGARVRGQSLVHKILVVMGILKFYFIGLSFKFKVVGGGPTAIEARSLSPILLFSYILDFYFYLLSFKFKVVGSGPTCQSLVIRFAHPTGRPSGAQQTTLCLQQQKVTKKCRKLNGEA